MEEYSQDQLRALKPEKEFFVGIDSDGCVFDTMEIKHKECFIPNIVKHWGLQAVSKYAREAAEFVNLYSKWRGINRFPALVMSFDLLAEREEVRKRGVKIPDIEPLRAWIERETRLGNPVLKQEAESTGDEVLKRALDWSESVNAVIAEMVEGVPPFPYVRDVLAKAAPLADMIVVSATPSAALRREWSEHDVAGYVKIIAGQEFGSKKEHIGLAAGGRYDPEKILMIGDAPGDLKAARGNDALFFPINPGREDESWQRLSEEAFDRFVGGTYAGAYETKLIDEFHSLLPETPPWK
jgi:phosphoglycolate phosphatase-like HAD superfamily hydrolase